MIPEALDKTMSDYLRASGNNKNDQRFIFVFNLDIEYSCLMKNVGDR